MKKYEVLHSSLKNALFVNEVQNNILLKHLIVTMFALLIINNH